MEHQRVSGKLAVSTVVCEEECWSVEEGSGDETISTAVCEEYVLYKICFVLVQGLCNETFVYEG